jgi:hypothetical protein
MRNRKILQRVAKPGLIALTAVAFGGVFGVGAARAASFSYVNTSGAMPPTPSTSAQS